MRPVSLVATPISALALAVLLFGCGGGGGSSSSGGSGAGATTAPASMGVFAGNVGGPGNTDGVGTAARFNDPIGIVVDNQGNLLVADMGNDTIRKVTPAGVVSTLTGIPGRAGSGGGTVAGAAFNGPSGLAYDSQGNLYVADTLNSTIRKITAAGAVSVLAGVSGTRGAADGAGTQATFYYPSGVAVDASGNVYVADTFNCTIRMITPAGVVTTLAGSAGSGGSSDGTGSAARFEFPYGIAVDASGNIYVADTDNNTIRKLTAGGVVTTLAGAAGVIGAADGTGSAASFSGPHGLATDSAGNIYVADVHNRTIRKVTPAGVVTTLAGDAPYVGSTDGTGTSAKFSDPMGVAIDASGNIYVTDTDNDTIRVVSSSNAVQTIAGVPPSTGTSDGQGMTAQFNYPYGAAQDASGNLYIADTGNNTIRKVTPAGTVSTFAGSPGIPGSADGVGEAARFFAPTGVALDAAGNVYVADTNNNTVRKITSNGNVTTLAGTPSILGGYQDGTGSSALFSRPNGMTVDSTGNVYVSDLANRVIRKITPGGVVTTLAGTPGIPGGADGVGSNASFNAPAGLAIDNAQNVYVADINNNNIRVISPAGNVSTLAGFSGLVGSADGAASAASFYGPTALAVNSAGDVYIADNGNNTIRKITPSGLVSTIVGTPGVAGFTAGALPGVITGPRGLVLDGATLYFTTQNGIVQITNIP